MEWAHYSLFVVDNKVPVSPTWLFPTEKRFWFIWTKILGVQWKKGKNFSLIFSIKHSWVNLRNYSTGWILYSFSGLALQLVAKFIGLTQSSLVILTWLFLFIKLHNPVGSVFLPVWDTVYKKKPQSLHNCIARKSKCCFLVKSKRPTPWLMSYSS